MKIRILIPLLTLASLLTIPAMAQVNYAVSGSTAYVTSSPNASGSVFIASTYNGFPVTRIGTSAFYACTNLTNVTIPNNVTNISDTAFRDCVRLTSVMISDSVITIQSGAFFACYSLTNVTIPRSMVSIGAQAFYLCTNLTDVAIPNSVNDIGFWAFARCTSLTNISVDAANSAYSSLDGVLFNKSQTTLIQCPGGRGGSYVMPGSVIYIGSRAFFYCTSLTNVTISGGVTTIGDSAFSSCTNLTNLTFLGNAPSAGVGTFSAIATDAKVYYYHGTTGWGPTFGGLPTVMLYSPPQVGDSSVGVKAGGFGFTINGVSNQTIVVEASTNLSNWQSIWTNTLSGASTNFVDPQWLNFPRRFYRLRSY